MDGDKYLTIQMQTWRKTIYNNNRDLIFHFGNYTYFLYHRQAEASGRHTKIHINSSSSTGMVAWLYRPWAASILARSPLPPDVFFSLALLFWNQILI